MDSKSKCSPVRIGSLYLFNSSWGPTEGEEEKKIVYYWPQETEFDTKLKKIGLVEGVITFSGKFSSAPASSLHTLKERTVFVEVEPEFWLCISVTLPSARKQGKETGEVIEFYPEEVSDEVLLSLIRRSHEMFGLFHSSLSDALTRCGGNKFTLRELVDHFYSRYLATLRVENGDITAVWGGMQYLALNALDFLRVQSFINRIQSDMEIISKCLFLQSGQLVWSGVEPGVTKLLVQYLSTTILPLLPNLSRQPDGSFLVGNDGKLPVLYIGDKTFNLAVFHAINTTLCLLLHTGPQRSFFNSFQDTVGQELGNLSADLTHSYISKSSSSPPSDQISFLYFNAANLAIKSTVEEGQEKLVKVGADFLEDLKRQGNLDGELMVKLGSEEWVVVQAAGARIIIQLLQDKNLNLIDVSEAVARLEKANFDSICML